MYGAASTMITPGPVRRCSAPSAVNADGSAARVGNETLRSALAAAAAGAHTVRMNFNRVHPLLLQWASHHSHLREITTAEIMAPCGSLPASRRRQTLTALRSLFGHARKTGTIFADPTRGIRDAPRPLNLLQPLQPGQISQAIAAAVTPATLRCQSLPGLRSGCRTAGSCPANEPSTNDQKA
jgi:hypothetical protein